MIVFVHGINGNGLAISKGDNDYPELVARFQTAFSPQNVHFFNYYQDRTFAVPSTGSPFSPPQCQSGTPAAILDWSDLMPLDTTSTADNACDSQSDLGIDAVMLNDFIQKNTRPTDHVAIVAHSMGGAITRGWLALVQRIEDKYHYNPAANVDTVITFQGAQQGSYIAAPNRLVPPVTDPVSWAENEVLNGAAGTLGFYRNRPANNELTPQSDWYNNINRTSIPKGIRYFNFYSDIQMRLATPIWFNTYLESPPADLGDLVMLPGSDNPQDTPLLGEARFRPDPTQYQSYEWQMSSSHRVVFNPIGGLDVSTLGAIIGDPASHFNLSRHMAGPTGVTVPDCEAPGASITILDQMMRVLGNPNLPC